MYFYVILIGFITIFVLVVTFWCKSGTKQFNNNIILFDISQLHKSFWSSSSWSSVSVAFTTTFFLSFSMTAPLNDILGVEWHFGVVKLVVMMKLIGIKHISSHQKKLMVSHPTLPCVLTWETRESTFEDTWQKRNCIGMV